MDNLPPASKSATILTPLRLSKAAPMGHGYNNTRIAETFFISEGTVKNHVTHIYDKLNLRTRAEAVAWAWQHDLVSNSE